MSEEKNITNEMELEDAAGGYVTPDEIHNLNNFTYRTVCNLPAGTFLQMQNSPNGGFLSPMYSNGQAIFVNSFYCPHIRYLFINVIVKIAIISKRFS